LRNFPISRFPFHIATILSLILLIIVACTSSTESSKGSLTGTISLEEQEDFSDITVELYALAYLDTTIVRINNQYPHIGVIINQHTEFDHRLQSPLYQTNTNADGSFSLKDIPTGKYNFVASKSGSGFRYINELNISTGDNSIPNTESNIILYEETALSGNISGEHIFETNHHYIIEDHTNFNPDSSLEIQPGAVVRINSGKDINIYGNFKAQGEINNMFWVTSNDGFDNQKLLLSEPALYNSMQIYPTTVVEDDVIEYGKWDWGNVALEITQISNLFTNSLIIRGLNSGINFNTCSDINVTKNIFQYALNSSFAGVYFSTSSYNNVEKNLFLGNHNGIQLHDTNNTELSDNYLFNCNLGIFNLIHSSSNTFHHNEIHVRQTGIFNAGSTININYNNINASVGIDNSNSYFASNGIPTINFNNFNCSPYAMRTTSFFHNGTVYLDAKNNWWNTTNEEEIQALIWDKNDEDPFGPNYNSLNAYYEYIPYRSQKVQNAGIQSN
jgi:parallel beta-helix repeat protein